MSAIATAPSDNVLFWTDSTTITVCDRALHAGTANFRLVNNCLHGHCNSCITLGNADCPFQGLAVYCPVELPVSFTVTCLSVAGSAS